MSEPLQILGIGAMFLIGLRLSAFFSGSETGFYRLSLPRLGIDAQSGDRQAARLLWYAHRPANFVATTLVGNNVANYCITVAVTAATAMALGESTEWAEIGATLLAAPVVFLFGELLPKNVYYRAPLSRMRTQILWFQGFYLLALPVSLPLVLLSRLLERMAGRRLQTAETLPGRGRFLQMISYGRHEGLLTPVQGTLATGVLAIATQPVTESMTPADRILGLPETASREELLAFARKFGTPVVALSDVRPGSDGAPRWTAYVRSAELQLRSEPISELRRAMPLIRPTATKLEALSLLHEYAAAYAVVVGDAGNVLGIVSRRGLAEQLFRPQHREAAPAARQP